MRWTVLGAVLFLGACGASDVDAIGDLPADTAFVAAVWEDVAGERVGSTPLVAYAPAMRLSADVGRDAERLFVFAWTEEDLAAVEVPEDVPRAPVDYASTADPVLPAPSWVGAGDAHERPVALALALSPGRPLTVGWLDACPRVLVPDETHYADVRCIPRPCGGGPVQVGCRLTIDVFACGIDGYEVELSATGAVEAIRAEGNVCREADAPPEAAFAFTCGTCRTELYSLPADTPDPFEVSRRTLAPPTIFEDLEDAKETAAPALLVDGDFAIVATMEDASSWRECAEGPRTTRLHFFSTDDASLVRTTTVAGCLFELERDPVAPGFLALDYARAVRRLVRYDAAGVELEHLDLDMLAEAPVREPLELAAFEAAERVVILAQPERRDAMIVFVRMSPFEISSASLLPDRRGRTMAEGDGFVVVGQSGRMELWDLETEAFRDELTLGTGEGIQNSPDGIAYFPEGQRIVSVNLGDRGGAHQIDLDRNLASARFYPDVRVPVSVARLTASYAVATVTRRGAPYDTALALYDVERARFLPRFAEIGRGPVPELAVDRTGRVWALLSAEGVLATATLR